MVSKRGQKRKADGKTVANGISDLTPPDRNSWSGWVEIESEPAFFNVMLKEMGVRGIKIHEVVSLDPDMLAILPQPIHALVFLFRYRAEDEQTNGAYECPNHVWFANQIPDFACATVAMLNILNNITGLDTGEELGTFRDRTRDMSPMARGEAIEQFEFVRRIHNSFATVTDMLSADMHLKTKMERVKKRQATAKANATKAAKKAEQAASQKACATSVAQGSAGRSRCRDTDPKIDPERNQDSDHGYKSSLMHEEGINGAAPRRSGRQPKPRQDISNIDSDEADEAGFHFVAYMPIKGHVWRMDGLDYFPQDIGSFATNAPDVKEHGESVDTSSWLDIVQPSLLSRMQQFEGADISYNLMAVVHDRMTDEINHLVKNIKSIQTIDERLDSMSESWREIDGAETKKDVLTSASDDLNISHGAIEASQMDVATLKQIASETNLLRLIELRQSIIAQQAQLRAGVRDGKAAEKADEDEAKHRRHDYSPFVRGWLCALAENETLSQLLED